MNTLRVAIVEDEAAMRKHLAQAVQNAPDLTLVAEFSNGHDALKWLAHDAPDVLLTDLGLPDLPGLYIINHCVQHHPQCHVMVITMYEDDVHVFRSLEAGAKGYLLKDALGDEVAEQIRVLAANGSPITPVIARRVLARMQKSPPVPASQPVALLTQRETLVLTRIAQGFSYAEVARLERISHTTVATHIRNIYGKLAVHSKNEAVFEASRMGLIDTGL